MDRARRYWDRRAATYDQQAGAERYFGPSRPWVASRATGNTLEIAIGTGANLGHYDAGLRLTGVDLSAAMLERARGRAAQLDIEVELHQADAAGLPFDDESFDTVVCTFALCCVPDLHEALDESVRVLRPGGRLLLADHVAAASVPLRLLQHLVNLFSVPLQSEWYTRRPSRELASRGIEIVEAERTHGGAIERVHGVKNGRGR